MYSSCEEEYRHLRTVDREGLLQTRTGYPSGDVPAGKECHDCADAKQQRNVPVDRTLHGGILAANTAYQRQFGTADKPCIGHKGHRVSHHYDVPCDQAGDRPRPGGCARWTTGRWNSVSSCPSFGDLPAARRLIAVGT